MLFPGRGSTTYGFGFPPSLAIISVSDWSRTRRVCSVWRTLPLPATLNPTAIEIDTEGTVERSGFELSFSSERDFVITGMAGAETSRTWAGTGTVVATSAQHDTDRDYEFTSTTTYANVVVPASGTVRWPTSGTATTTTDLEVTGGADVGKDATVTSVVTFNGTANVPLKIGNVTYSLNLDTHVVTGP